MNRKRQKLTMTYYTLLVYHKQPVTILKKALVTRGYFFPPVLDVGAYERDLLEVEVTADGEGAHHVVDVYVHFRSVLF